MKKYPKIQSLFERIREGDNKGYIKNEIRNKDSIKALLQCKDLIFEEKVDGSSSQLKIYWNEWIGEIIKIYSRNNELATITNLGVPKLEDEFKDVRKDIVNTINEKAKLHNLSRWYEKNLDIKETKDGVKTKYKIPVKLFGEVIGGKIQGNKYTNNKDEFGFILFDIKIGNSWLSVGDRNKIAEELGLDVPEEYEVNLELPNSDIFESIKVYLKTYKISMLAKKYGRKSKPEGFIIKPKISLYVNSRDRVIGKIKRKDYKDLK